MTETEQPNYRGYFFGNMYLSSIQQGIQAAHVIQDMQTRHQFLAYPASLDFDEWMARDRTMILLNGGYQSALQALYDDLMDWTEGGTIYPVGRFYEEQDALNGALTSVGVVLPEKVYAMDDTNIAVIGGDTPVRVESDMSHHTLTFPDNIDYKISQRIKEFKLAN